MDTIHETTETEVEYDSHDDSEHTTGDDDHMTGDDDHMTTRDVDNHVTIYERQEIGGQSEEDRVVLSNNFILPMETVETMNSEEMTEGKSSKKLKREKKDGRFYKFVKRHILQRKQGANDVREIHIVPEGDELKWACRSAGSAASRSSDETTSSEEDRLEVVHDMAEEYIPDV